MVKKILSTSLIIAFAAIIFFVFYFLKNQQTFDNNDSFDLIQNDAIVVIQFNNLEKLNELLENKTNYSNQLSVFESFVNFKKIVDFTSFINLNIFQGTSLNQKRKQTLSVHPVDGENNDWLLNFPIKNNTELKVITNFLNKNKEESNKKNTANIYKFNADSIYLESFYASIKNGVLSISPSLHLVENIQKNRSTDSVNSKEGFKKIKNTTLNDFEATLYLNFTSINKILPKFINKQNYREYFSWAGFDFNIRKNEIFLNGFVDSNSDSLFASIFKGIEPATSSIPSILPLSTKLYLNYSFASIEKFKDNFQNYVSKKIDKNANNRIKGFEQRHNNNFFKQFFSIIENEMSLAYVQQEDGQYLKMMVLKTTGQTKALNELLVWINNNKRNPNPTAWIAMDAETKYPYYEMPEATVMRDCFEFLFPEVPSKHFAFYENYVVFADDSKAIYEFLYANLLKKNLSTHPYFSSFYENFGYKENFFFFTEAEHFHPLSKDFLNKNIFSISNAQKEVLSKFYGVGVQLSTTADLLYSTIYANYTPNRDKEPQTIWQSRLDSTIVGKPTIVTNHNTNENEVLIQDSKNNLYLINNVGRILWKRPLDGIIKSEIFQVDYYKNNKLQYLFNTENRIYILDRNGNFVDKYPITLPEKATNGISVYDYERNKDYRIFIALADNKVYLFDKNGNRNIGWVLFKTESRVTSPIQHFVTQGRDYIVFADENRAYILNRRGEHRTTPNKLFSKMPNSIFYLENQFAANPALLTIDNKGNIIKIALPSGNTEIRNEIAVSIGDKLRNMTFHQYNNGEKRAIITTDKSLFIYDENFNLKIAKTFDNEISPIVDIYGFSASDYKIGVVEQQGNKIHLLNFDGTNYKGFPLKGTSRFSIGFLKSSYRFNLITGGEQNYLYNYLIE